MFHRLGPPAITQQLLDATEDRRLFIICCDYCQDRASDWSARCNEQRKPYDDHWLLALPRGLQWTWHIAGIEFEVPNGGFYQFFSNSTGIYTLDTLEALRATSMRERASLLEAAIELLHQRCGRPRDYRERWFGEEISDGLWENVQEDLSKLEARYYEIAANDFDGYARYVRAHPEAFLHP
jgi:hypothetical protein